MSSMSPNWIDRIIFGGIDDDFVLIDFNNAIHFELSGITQIFSGQSCDQKKEA